MKILQLRLKGFQSFGPESTTMAIESEESAPRIRVRLTAGIAADGEVDERTEYVLAVDANGEPTNTTEMSRYDRGHIEVYHLPTRRDPADHISSTTASLIGRTLRAAASSSERESLTDLMTDVTDVLLGNEAVASIGKRLASEWSGLHTGAFFRDPSIAFGR